MKKRMAVFVALIMVAVLCLALTGCGQKADKQEATTSTNERPGENFDTGDSSIMDGTNNPEGTTQSGEETDSSDNSGSTDGTYSWQVGGSTITTQINVMDYIDGNVWRANEMAAALGWDPIAMKIDGSYSVSMKSKKPANFKSNGLLIYYSDAGSKCNGISGHIEGGDLAFNISFGTNNGDYSYRMNDSDFYWTIEEIVCFAYAMENMPSDNDPFSGILSGSDSNYSFQ